MTKNAQGFAQEILVIRYLVYFWILYLKVNLLFIQLVIF